MRSKDAGAVEKKGRKMNNNPRNPKRRGDHVENTNRDILNRVDRIRDLTWALLDDQISDAEVAELERMLEEDSTARANYLRCVQLHTDLAGHFAPPTPERDRKKTTTPILGFLGEASPTLGTAPTNQTV